MAEQDGLTAAADAIPHRDASVLTLGDCRRDFIRRRTPPLLAAAVIGALALRIALGHWDWHDAVVAVGVVAFTPPVEWAIHVYLLHAKPFLLFGRRIDLLAAASTAPTTRRRPSSTASCSPATRS